MQLGAAAEEVSTCLSNLAKYMHIVSPYACANPASGWQSTAVPAGAHHVLSPCELTYDCLRPPCDVC